MKFLTLFLACILCGGCAHRLSALPEGQGTKENVTILRNWNIFGAGIRYWPTVDDAEVAGVAVREHISFNLFEGKHVLGVRCFGGVFPIWHHDQLETEIKDQTPRFFLLSPSPICAEIEEIDAAEATQRLKGSTRVYTGPNSGEKPLAAGHPLKPMSSMTLFGLLFASRLPPQPEVVNDHRNQDHGG